MFIWFIAILAKNILYTKQFILDRWFCTQDCELLMVYLYSLWLQPNSPCMSMALRHDFPSRVSSYSRIYAHVVYSSYSKQDFLFYFPFSSAITDTTVYKKTIQSCIFGCRVVVLKGKRWCTRKPIWSLTIISPNASPAA